MADTSKHDLLRENKSRLFIITEFVDGTQNSTGYYWSKIIQGLSERFNEIRVICPKSSYKKIGEIPEFVTYILVNDVEYNKKKLTSRLFGQIAQSLYFAKAIIKNVKNGDVVFSGTNPALLLILISVLKAIKAFKWVLLVHDVFPENLIAAKVFESKCLLYRSVKYLFDKVYSTADTLIAIGRDMQVLLNNKTKGINRIEYIPNWVDSKDIFPLARESSELIHSYGFGKKIVFQFFGNLGRLQGIKNLLNAISLVENEKAAFMFIGSGSEDAFISNFIQNNPKKNIVQLPSVPLSQNNIVLSSCDVAIVSLSEGMNGLGVPSKAYFSLAANKPLLVLTEENSELFYLISEGDKVGWFCEVSNPVKLASLIDSICRESIADIQDNPRNLMLKKYGNEKAIENYTKCISELLEMTDGKKDD